MKPRTGAGVVLALLLLAWVTPGIFAQDDPTCPTLVQAAYEATRAACEQIGRNEACYGNVRVTAQPASGAATLVFATPGDIVNLADIASLQLSSLDTASGEWGISQLRVQANLPDADRTQNVEVLLFGNVQMRDAAAPASAAALPTVTLTPQNNVNVRGGPSTSDAIVGTAAGGQTVTADGRNAAGDWLRINLGTAGAPVYGWVFAALFTVEGDVNALVVIEAGASVPPVAEAAPPSPYGPMQAFYFTSGTQDRPCAEAPDSGILIQTPEGAGEITLLVNEVIIDLGSTAYLQAVPGDHLSISLVEGQAIVTAQGTSVAATAGMAVRVPLDANGAASGAPLGPEPFAADLTTLPVILLGRPVAIAPALTQEEIEALYVAPAAGGWRVNWAATGSGVCPDGTDFATPRFTSTASTITVNADGSLVISGLFDLPPVNEIALTPIGPGFYVGQSVMATFGGGNTGETGKVSDNVYELRLHLTTPDTIAGRLDYREVFYPENIPDDFEQFVVRDCPIHNTFTLQLSGAAQ